MDKSDVFKLIELTLINNDIEEDKAAEIADSLVEQLDEEGFFDEDDDDVDF